MKSYYDNQDTFTEESQRVLAEVDEFMFALYKRELAAGFSIRELTGIVCGSAGMAESRTIIDVRMAQHKANQIAKQKAKENQIK